MVDKFNFVPVPFRFYIHVSSISLQPKHEIELYKNRRLQWFYRECNVKNGYGFKQIMCSIILKYNVTFKILNMLVGLVFRARLIWSHHGFSRSSTWQDRTCVGGGCSFFPSVTNHVEIKRVVYTTLLHGQNTDKSWLKQSSNKLQNVLSAN